jgi:DNA-directed RNA polymerase subunit D
MDIKLLHKQENKTIFLIKKTEPAFVNTLRRIMTCEVPVMAIKKVNFTKNTSPLYDEIIAHRLGMIPLLTDLDSYILAEKCSCSGAGCAKCQLNVVFKAEGPITVYDSDLKFQDPKIKPVYGKMPIIKLLKGQELEFEATAGLGKSEDHAKFSTGLIHYRGCPEFTITKKTQVKACIRECNDLLKEDGDNLEVVDFIKWNEAYEQICEEHRVLVNNSNKNFIFTVESWGKLSALEIFNKALNVFDEKLDELSEKVKKA